MKHGDKKPGDILSHHLHLHNAQSYRGAVAIAAALLFALTYVLPRGSLRAWCSKQRLLLWERATDLDSESDG